MVVYSQLERLGLPSVRFPLCNSFACFAKGLETIERRFVPSGGKFVDWSPWGKSSILPFLSHLGVIFLGWRQPHIEPIKIGVDDVAAVSSSFALAFGNNGETRFFG